MMLMSTLSLNVFAGSIFPGTKDEEIHLEWKYFAYDKDAEDNNTGAEVHALEAGKTYSVKLIFADNPEDEKSTIMGLRLTVKYDAEAVAIPATGEDTEQWVYYTYAGTPFFANDGNGQLTAQLATTSGIKNSKNKIVKSGAFFEAVIDAKKDVTKEDLKTLFQIDQSDSKNMIFDVNEKNFTIVECPTFTASVKTGADILYTSSNAEKIANNLTGKIISADGTETPVTSGITVELNDNLTPGKNTVTAKYDGYTCDVVIDVVADERDHLEVEGTCNLSYTSGQTLNLTGLTVYEVWKGGNRNVLAPDVYGTIPSKTTPLTVKDHDKMTLKVKLGELEADVGTLTVSPADISTAVIGDITGQTYQGEAGCKPEPTVTLNDETLTLGEDYTLSYENNVNAGENAKIKVTGKEPEYTGSTEKTFTIGKATGELTLKVNNQEGNAVTVTYGDALTFTGNGAVINADTASETKIQYKTENGAYADFDYDTVLNAGTYTFKAVRLDTPNVAATESTNEVVVTITQKTITTPTVTITGFGKGASTDNVQYSFNPNVLTVSGTPVWYVGRPVGGTSHSGTFKAETDYSVSLNFTVNSNYVLAPVDGKLTASIAILGETKTVPVTQMYDNDNQLTGYNIVVSAKTEDRIALVVPNPPTATATWGTLLKDVTIKATEAYAVTDTARMNPIPGHFEWMETYPANKDVEEPTDFGSSKTFNTFRAKFIPTNQDDYAILTDVPVHVLVKHVTLKLDDVNGLVANELTYNGQNQSVELNVPDWLKKLIDDKAVTIVYSGETQKDVSDDYKVTATIKILDTAHYIFFKQDETGVRELPWSIKKAKLTLPDKAFNAYYNSASVDKTLADLGLSDLADEPELNLLFSNLENTKSAANVNKVTDANGKITGISIKLDATSRVNDVVGVHVTVSSKNYEDAEFNIRITLEDKAQDTSTMSVSVADITYGETPNPQVTGKPAGTSDLTYKYEQTNSSAAAIPTYNEETIKNAPAGEYTLTVTCEGATKYYIATDNFEIKPREITANDVSFGYTLTYTGEKQTQTVIVTINGTTLTAGTDYTADPSGVNGETKTSEDSMSLTAPGTYTVTVTGKGNYKGTVEKTFTVGKASLKNAIVGTIAPVNYDGTAKTPEPAVFFNELKLTEGTDYELSYSNNTNVGTATITITAKADSAHFTGSTSTTFKIEKATPTITLVSAASVDYTGAQYSNKNVEVTKPSDIEVTYEYYLQSDTACTTQVKPIDAGSYKVRISFAGNDNYNAVQPTATVDFTIGRANHPISIAAASVTYTGAPYSETNITVTPTCEVTFTYYASETSTDSIARPTDVGIYWVVASYAGTDNYNSSTSARVSFSINKATPPTPPEVKVDGEDKTLKDLEDSMRKDLGNIDGKFTWRDSDGKELPFNTKIEANKEYEWIFTPSGKDAQNYAPISGKTTPYVRDDLSWLPGVLGGGSTFNFRDVTRYDYFYSAVKWAAENGIASGTSRYTFSPDAVCTRAQTVTFLWRAAGSPMPTYRISPFTDVNYGDYYYNAVLWAVEQGITTGLTATTFGPDKTVTRGQVAMFLYRAASAVKPNITNSFTDVKSTAYNYDAILWAYDNRITTGTSTTTFSPDAFCTRAQIVTFLYRFYQGR